MENKKLSIKQALEQGYEFCGWANETYQRLKKIEDLDDSDFLPVDNDYLVLAEKEPFYAAVDAEGLIEYCHDQYHDQTNDDDYDDSDDSIKELILDFKELATKVNEKLKSKPHWRLTKIQLTN